MASSEALSRSRSLEQREWLLRLLTAATFLIFFQGYMVAPMIPHLATVFQTSLQKAGLVVPAYMIAYGVTSLVFGLLADRIGRKRVMLISLAAIAVLPLFTATSQSIDQLIGWRFLTGLGASGVIPQILTLIGDLFPYGERGRPLGWVFGAMAGGMAFGSVFGVILEAWVGWRILFIAISIPAMILLRLLWEKRQMLRTARTAARWSWSNLWAGYCSLLTTRRGQRTYFYVFLNGIFHSGVYTWLGLYFAQRYGLSEAQIGLALLGYGIPGTLLGPVIGRTADRWGRSRILPLGFLIAGLSAIMLIFNIPLLIATLATTALSLGYDMTQPLLAGIVTDLNTERRGQAMGLNVFILFIGFGVGGFLFGELLRLGFNAALVVFAVAMILGAFLASILFQRETTKV